MHEYTLEFELLLNDTDEAYTNCEIDVFFTYYRGSRSFFDRLFGNWVPGDAPEIKIDQYVIYPENNLNFDLATVKKLNPDLDHKIYEAISELSDDDLIYGDD